MKELVHEECGKETVLTNTEEFEEGDTLVVKRSEFVWRRSPTQIMPKKVYKSIERLVYKRRGIKGVFTWWSKVHHGSWINREEDEKLIRYYL